jgi:hypothetical protein
MGPDGARREATNPRRCVRACREETTRALDAALPDPVGLTDAANILGRYGIALSTPSSVRWAEARRGHAPRRALEAIRERRQSREARRSSQYRLGASLVSDAMKPRSGEEFVHRAAPTATVRLWLGRWTQPVVPLLAWVARTNQEGGERDRAVTGQGSAWWCSRIVFASSV